jgi:hypothetical protein
MVAALPLALAACGTAPAADDGVVSAGGGTAKASASPTASMSEQEAGVKFAQCMREHGIPMNDPQAGRIQVRVPRGMSEAKAKEAQKACDPIMQSVVHKGDRTMDPQEFDRMVKFAQCMRKHGIDVPDPKPGEGLQMMIKGGQKEKVEAAQEACKEFEPGAPKMSTDGGQDTGDGGTQTGDGGSK